MALADLPLDELVVALKDPATKAAILSEADAPPDPGVLFDGIGAFLLAVADNLYVMGDPPDYEPTPETSIGGIADGHRPRRPRTSSTTGCSTTTARAS